MSDKQIQEYLLNRIIDQLTGFLIEDHNLELEEALNVVYNSKVYLLLQIKDADLVSQSPAYIYELLKKEIVSN